MNPYETQKLVDEYLLFHYGSAEEILEWPMGPRDALGFAVRTVTDLMDWEESGAKPERALDVGCAVGRSSFELSTRCEEVIGIDYSAAFVEAAQEIGTRGSRAYERLDEGHHSTRLEAVLPVEARADRVRFETGDAMDLRADLGSFDLAHAANLLCRLPEPRRFLSRLPDLIRKEGWLILTTPATWLEDFTPRENWPPGSTLDYLESELGTDFELIRTADLPFLIRETRRKFQWTVAQGSLWRKR